MYPHRTEEEKWELYVKNRLDKQDDEFQELKKDVKEIKALLAGGRMAVGLIKWSVSLVVGLVALWGFFHGRG